MVDGLGSVKSKTDLLLKEGVAMVGTPLAMIATFPRCSGGWMRTLEFLPNYAPDDLLYVLAC